MRTLTCRIAAVGAAALTQACATLPSGDLRSAVIEIDERQRGLVAAADAEGLAHLAHDDLQINSPNGRVLGRDEFLRMVRAGEIRAEEFTRTAEVVRVTRDKAFVMGREIYRPVAQSELGRRFGAVPLERRYTNVYVFEKGRWRWWARHANVVTP